MKVPHIHKRYKIYTQDIPSPRWNSPCRGEGAYPPRSSNQSASTRRARLSVAAKVVRPTDLLNMARPESTLIRQH